MWPAEIFEFFFFFFLLCQAKNSAASFRGKSITVNTERKRGKRNSWRGRMLINQAEVFPCVRFTNLSKKIKHLKVAFAGWPLSGCAYLGAVDSASDVLVNTMIFSHSAATSSDISQWTLEKGRWIVPLDRTSTWKITEPKSSIERGGLFSRWTLSPQWKSSKSRIKGSIQAFYAARPGSKELFFFFFPFCLNEDERFCPGKAPLFEWKRKDGQIKRIITRQPLCKKKKGFSPAVDIGRKVVFIE